MLHVNYLCVYVYICTVNFTKTWDVWFFSRKHSVVKSTSINVLFCATYAQTGREEKSWILWFLLNQWFIGKTGLQEKLKQSENVHNSQKQSAAVRHDHAKFVNTPFLLNKRVSARFLFLKVQLEMVGNSWSSYLWLGRYKW